MPDWSVAQVAYLCIGQLTLQTDAHSFQSRPN